MWSKDFQEDWRSYSQLSDSTIFMDLQNTIY